MYKISLTKHGKLSLQFDNSLELNYYTITNKFIVDGGEKSTKYTINSPNIQFSIVALINDIIEVSDPISLIPDYYDAISTFIHLTYNLYYKEYISYSKGIIFNMLNTYSVIVSHDNNVNINYRNGSRKDILSTNDVEYICKKLTTLNTNGTKLKDHHGYIIINDMVNKLIELKSSV